MNYIQFCQQSAPTATILLASCIFSGISCDMRLLIHLLAAAQIVGWALYFAIAALGAENADTVQRAQGFSLLGVFTMLLCLIPALRYARRIDRQPFALLLCLLPLIVLAIILALDVSSPI